MMEGILGTQTIYEADVIVVGFGAAGGCSAIEAHDAGAEVLIIEKQPQDAHYSNSRMSGGGYHSPRPDGDRKALKAYARAMFSGENIGNHLDGEIHDFADDHAQLWADLAPDNDAFMRRLDPQFNSVEVGAAAFRHFPGAAESGYSVMRSTYSGNNDGWVGPGWGDKNTPALSHTRSEQENGEAFHACMVTGLATRNIPVHYGIRARSLILDEAGAVVGVKAERDGNTVIYRARRGVVLTCGGYEYNRRMRQAFLDGPGAEAWAFYGTSANTGDGIEMALRAGAGLTKASSVAARVIAAVPERRNGLKVGLNTTGIGKPNEIVVDNYGSRYAAERRITKDPSRYFFYKEALQFDTVNLTYPRIPSWMIFDATLMEAGPVVNLVVASYNAVEWGSDNRLALEKGWILQAETIEDLAARIREHPDNHGRMETERLATTVTAYNSYCAAGADPDFQRQSDTLGPVAKAPFYAIPLYMGGPNTKGGLRANARRQVLDWQDEPIARLYTAGEIASVFQFVYQGGGNLAECITFGRVAGRNAAAESAL
ncbi:hypothetical protein ASD80_06845 [Devosia sp. Root635]|nr:hypothetical protein ASD80_06845 [Devosia sp. Root635]